MSWVQGLFSLYPLFFVYSPNRWIRPIDSLKAYSIDLRQKIIETYENEQVSQRQLAQRFRVATSFVVKLLKQYRETGNIAPR